MLGYIEIGIFKKKIFSIKARRGLQRKKLLPARSHFFREYFRASEFLRKTILTCLLGALMGSIHEKNMPKKSRDTSTLNSYCTFARTEKVIFHIGSKMTDKH